MSDTGTGAVQILVDTPTKKDILLYDFGVSSSRLGRPNHTSSLDNLVAFLENPNTGPMTVNIDGLASHTGSQTFNLGLSEDREQTVENYLRARTSVFDSGKSGTINRNFRGFSTSPPGENARFRAVRVVVDRPGVTPPPIDPTPTPPVGPLTSNIGKFEIDLIGWIPNPDLANPLAILPKVVSDYLPNGMADDYFAGDNFRIPSTTPEGMKPPSHTFRARQHIEFYLGEWGSAPIRSERSTEPGITRCLNKKRAEGGVVTYQEPARVLRGSPFVSYDAAHDWYEVTLSGVVVDPVPAHAAGILTSKLPLLPQMLRPPVARAIAALATLATPSLTWDVTLRIQNGSVLDPLTSLSYKPFFNDESSAGLPGAGPALSSGAHLIHGSAHFSFWPSAVIFVTLTQDLGNIFRQPVFFSDGSGARLVPAPIEAPKFCKIRQITW